MTHILVTGGAGYIGSHTVVELLNANVEVTIFDNLVNSSRVVLDRIQQICGKSPDFIEGDIRDSAALAAVFQRRRGHSFCRFEGGG